MKVSRLLSFSALFVGILCVCVLFLGAERNPAQNLITGTNKYQWSAEVSTPACEYPALKDTADGKTQQITSFFTNGVSCGFVILVGSDYQYVIYGGAAGPSYASIRQATFSTNGQPIYLGEHVGATEQLLYDIVVNGVVQQTLNSLTLADNAFNQLANPDYSSTSYNPQAIRTTSRSSHQVNSYSEDYSSPDGKRMVQLVDGGAATVHVYQYLKEGSWKSQNYGTINGIWFSPDSKHLAYAVQDEARTLVDTGFHVVVDNQSGTNNGRVVFLQFSKDSSKLWFLECPVDTYPNQVTNNAKCFIVQRVLQ